MKMFRALPRKIKELLENGDFYVITFRRREIIAQADYSEKLEYELLQNGFVFEEKFTSEGKVFKVFLYQNNDKISVQITLVKEV